MGAEWRDCIVTVLDLTGIKARAGTGEGSSLMRRLQALVQQEAPALRSVAHAYAWNDSVLLLSYVTKHNKSFEAAVRDAERLKRKVDAIRKSYAVAVKGRTFPVAHAAGGVSAASCVTLIEASSWAMANALEIPVKVGSVRGQWYLDARIAKRIRTTQPCETTHVLLLPSKKRRAIHVYKGYLWDEGEQLGT